MYYCIWIDHYAINAGPIYQLFKKNSKFEWGFAQAKAIDHLKKALTMSSALMLVDYADDIGAIFLLVNISLSG